jgi:glycosyltransferase involved in cell wall biosynthesis
LHPREYPSGSGYHLHDLIALGLAEEGHEVLYYVRKGAEEPMPPGVAQVHSPVRGVDICHFPIGPAGFAEEFEEFTAAHRIPCLMTCHMRDQGKAAASNWVFVSDALARDYGSGRVVMNGINPADLIFSETKSDYFLFMGAMNKACEKGLDHALALSKREGFQLIVAGTGLNYETIRWVSELCSAAGAEYVGDVRGTRKAELIAGARAVLFPSRLREGCPLVILEAMLSGTPVLSSPCGGAVEVVTPETGFLCEQDGEWSAALGRLSRISPHRCRQVALEKYHYRRMVKDYLREYEREVADFTA